MFFTELFYSIAVCPTEVLSDDLFSDIATDVFAVVAWFFTFDLLLLGLEDLGAEILVVVGGMIGEDEWSFAICGWSNEFSEDGVVGLLAGQPVDRLKNLFL